ncbi:MAG: hypothetical protein Q4A74_00205 [Cardiobacteriaceae bacterium]|nr:hypothetical protein [Cardiobacteriaceae bacterium]
MMDRDSLYYVELAVSGEPPNFSKGKWAELDDAVDNFDSLRISTAMRENVNSKGIEIRLWSYEERRKR